MTGIGVLTLVVSVLGLLPWRRPVWSPSFAWMVTDVPGQLWAVLLGTAVVCLGIAIATARRALDLGLRRVSSWSWLAVLLLAAATLVWNALCAAALSTIDFGAPSRSSTGCSPSPRLCWPDCRSGAAIAGSGGQRHCAAAW